MCKQKLTLDFLVARIEARTNARIEGDYTVADGIRDLLADADWKLEDMLGGTLAISGIDTYNYRVYVPDEMLQSAFEAPVGYMDTDVVVIGSSYWAGMHDFYFSRIGYKSGRDNVWAFPFRVDKTCQVSAWRLVRACLQGVRCNLDIPRSVYHCSNLNFRCVTLRLKPIGNAWEIFDFLPCIDPVDTKLPLLYEE